MSRPLTGSVKANACGTFTVSVPIARGSKTRRTATFDVRADAQAWADACVAALLDGRDLPEPSDFRARRRSAFVDRSRFVEVAESWIQEYYLEDDRGDIEREKQVRRYVTVMDEYLVGKGLCVEDITRDHARAMYRALKADTTSPSSALPDALDPEELVTAAEARTHLARHGWANSASSFKRARASDRLAPAASRGRTHLFRLGDVFDPAAGLASSKDTKAPQDAHSTLQDVRWVFRAVLDHAKTRGVSLPPGVRKAGLPKDKTRKAKTRALTSEQLGRIARHLHVVPQLALMLVRLPGWHQRGLRIERRRRPRRRQARKKSRHPVTTVVAG